ncbi:hypothetical protein GCWU000341_02414 [Oribacterium sp. oral taxon 078 str. F0262]|nr:hypothetical protein GCWU000341_02414 [Oribacterium sp. oral taxon 078 str. F0262]
MRISLLPEGSLHAGTDRFGSGCVLCLSRREAGSDRFSCEELS